MKRGVQSAFACLALVALFAACAAKPVVRTFTFDDVEDETGTSQYAVGKTAVGTVTERPGAPMAAQYTVSIQLTSTDGNSVTAHPTLTLYFDDSTVHCFADGSGSHDPVSLTTSTTSTQLTCEEPFPDPIHILRVTVTDAGT